jgi:hypothetical protein
VGSVCQRHIEKEKRRRGGGLLRGRGDGPVGQPD